MTRPKLQDTLAYPPRGMNADRAAAYCGLSTTAFLGAVNNGDWPQPRDVGGGIFRWDRADLDAAWDAKRTRERKRLDLPGRRSMDDLMEAEDVDRENQVRQ